MIVGNGELKYLNRDLAIHLVVSGAVTLAHASGPEVGEDLVRAEARAGRQRGQTGLILAYGRREPG